MQNDSNTKVKGTSAEGDVQMRTCEEYSKQINLVVIIISFIGTFIKEERKKIKVLSAPPIPLQGLFPRPVIAI